MPKETGIIMSGNHPGLILEGKKTMTRRVIKFKSPLSEFGREWSTPFTNDGLIWVFTAGFGMALRQLRVKCPYGQVGDRLWVKETWYQAQDEEIEYRADWAEDQVDYVCPRWRPSIFMPRRASRILLEITEVRVERLESISYEDSKKEGCISISDFAILWNSINGKRGYSWESNCWCWVISFKVVKE